MTGGHDCAGVFVTDCLFAGLEVRGFCFVLFFDLIWFDSLFLLLKDFLDARGFNFCFCFCLCFVFFLSVLIFGVSSFSFLFFLLCVLILLFACLAFSVMLLLWLFLFCFLLLLLFSVLFFAFSFTSYNIICARAHTQIICTHTTHIHTQNNMHTHTCTHT